MRAHLLVALALVLTAGCHSQTKIVPVSGKVTLDGVPLANATVSFQPAGVEGKNEIGVASVGTTNEKGEFTLRTTTGAPGAEVGKHEVLIVCVDGGDPDSDAPRPRGKPRPVNKVPKKYAGNLTYDVPAGGTDKADFELDTK
jgi:hypothetical protein